MQLYLQFGHGMMSLCKELITKWKGGTVILSPRDLSLDQMAKVSKDLRKVDGNVVLDPQFYIPHSNHSRLTKHSFWPIDYQTSLFNKSEICTMLNILKNDYNDVLNTSFFILPSSYSSIINDDWFIYNNLIVDSAKSTKIEKELYLTLPLSCDVLCSEEQTHQLLEYLYSIEVSGYYIVPEPPAKSYLIDNPSWLLNLLDLCAGIKLLGKKIVVGYCSHQMLCLALSQVDAIASGNWLNVRSFNTNKFNEAEESTSRRSTWYYCPQALSEYQIPFLDVANRVGKLPELQTDSIFDSPYSDILFSGIQPTTVNFNEGSAFKHYLQCLKVQTELSSKSTYLDTKASLLIQLETANGLLQDFQENGIRGRDRDFSKVLDINISALDAFHRLRGMMSQYSWNA